MEDTSLLPMGGQTPIPTAGLYTPQPYQPPQGLCRAVLYRVGAAGGAGDPATASLVHLGPHLWPRDWRPEVQDCC